MVDDLVARHRRARRPPAGARRRVDGRRDQPGRRRRGSRRRHRARARRHRPAHRARGRRRRSRPSWARAPDGFATLEEVADAIADYQPHRPRPRHLDGLAKNVRLGDDGRYHWHWDPRFRTGRTRPRGPPQAPGDVRPAPRRCRRCSSGAGCPTSSPRRAPRSSSDCARTPSTSTCPAPPTWSPATATTSSATPWSTSWCATCRSTARPCSRRTWRPPPPGRSRARDPRRSIGPAHPPAKSELPAGWTTTYRPQRHVPSGCWTIDSTSRCSNHISRSSVRLEPRRSPPARRRPTARRSPCRGRACGAWGSAA